MRHQIAALLLSISCWLPAIAATEAELDVEQYKGKVVYVDFWASWCKPCRASFPFMQDMADKFGDSLVIVAINVDEDRADAARFLEAFDVNFRIIYDPSGKIAERYDIKGMPSSYLYDQSGRLLGTHVGFRNKDREKLESVISAAVSASN